VDNETDLVWYEYRAYSPSLGRFISRDPIEEAGGRNLYSFVKNGPQGRFDLRGLWGRSLHLNATFGWAFAFSFNLHYSATIGEADESVDHGRRRSWPWPFTDIDRHMLYFRDGIDSRLWWYETEFETAMAELAAGQQTQQELHCVRAAQAFGRGLHSLQDRSAHRDWPWGDGTWFPWVQHPGWWDAWLDTEYEDTGWFDWFWSVFVDDPIYDPWAEAGTFAQLQQRQSQEQARMDVVRDSMRALGRFEASVRNTCFCRERMLEAR
jgi:hypothetical protein